MSLPPRPALPADPEATVLAGLVDQVRTGAATTRPELVTATRHSRKVVTQHVERAIELGLLENGELAPSGGGRQPRTLRFRAGAGHVLGAVVGAAEMTAAVLDLAGAVVASTHRDWSVEEGPEATMAQLEEMLSELVRRTGVTSPWGIGVGVPGPVEPGTGRLVAPPIMPGWHGFSVRSWLRERHDAPVWVDNDVNLMALGEWTRGAGADGRDMLYIKVGTGIGAGLVVRGRLLRGDLGAAGDIGHVRVADPGPPCRCGRSGCLEAVAGGWALVRDATALAHDGRAPSLAARLSRRELTAADVGAAAAAGEPAALELLEVSAVAVADVVSQLVNLLNPGVLVLGGGVLRTGPRFLQVLDQTVRERCTELAVRRLQVRPASLDHLEGVVGAGLLAAEDLLQPAALAHWAPSGSPLGHAAALMHLDRGPLV